MNFWFDRNSKKTFSIVEQTYKGIRETVGNKISPSFNVLAKNSGEFYVEEIEISKVEVDLNLNYNDNFLEVDSLVQNSILMDGSGLILLHGHPGTGKTTYIKHLLSQHHERNFIFIPNDFINELLQPDFISFLLTQKGSILVIEDAEKVISSREKVNKDSVVSTILQLTDGLFSDFLNIKVICTFNTDLKNIDLALLRKGRMLAFYEFKELSISKTNNLLEKLNQEHSNKQMTLADIYHINDKEYRRETTKIGFINSV